jgi:agmatine deiminase
VSYINFYMANGGIIMPTADQRCDASARSLLQDIFPDRRIVPVPGRTLFYGGGGVHCITQQVPATVEYP